MKLLNIGTLVEVDSDSMSRHVVEVLDSTLDISKYCGLKSGPGFVGKLIINEFGFPASEDSIELCYSNDMIIRELHLDSAP